MANLKELSKKEEILTGGHRLCGGCGASIVARQVLAAAKNPVVVGLATGCLEVSTTIFPYTAWRCSYIHNAFENVAATISGVETAHKALRRRGRIPDEDYDFVAFGGDGGTYDIGLQALSGAMERGHNMLYVCYDNGAYMNTGIQRSSATPSGADTSTSPAGSVIPGKTQHRKELTDIIAAHNIPYVAQAVPSNWRDMTKKAEKALDKKGAAFINTLAVCPRGWRSAEEKGIEITQLAVDTCYWPLFEVEDGEWRLTYKPKEKKPLEEWFKVQGRFRHLFKEENRHLLQEAQDYIDRRWEKILRLCGEKE